MFYCKYVIENHRRSLTKLAVNRSNLMSLHSNAVMLPSFFIYLALEREMFLKKMNIIPVNIIRPSQKQSQAADVFSFSFFS